VTAFGALKAKAQSPWTGDNRVSDWRLW
jgi:hypothetical protein